MRIAPHRHPDLAAALALCAAVGSLTGCTAAGPTFEPSQHQPVIIVVTFDQSEGKISSVSPEPAVVSEKYKQHPVWYLLGAPEGSKIETKFKKEDPLEPEERVAKAEAVTKGAADRCEVPTFRRGVPKPGTAGKKFAYAVIVTLPDRSTKTLDPEMQIWP